MTATQPTRQQVLAVLAALTPSAYQQRSRLAVPTEWFRWLPLEALRTLAWQPTDLYTGAPATAPAPAIPIERDLAERLSAIGTIRWSDTLFIGWLWVAGRTSHGGHEQSVLHPLVTLPVRVERSVVGGGRLVRAGDPGITPLVTDIPARQRLEHDLEVGGGALDDQPAEVAAQLLARLHRLHAFAADVCEQAGFGSLNLTPVSTGPERLLANEGLTVVAGAAVYVARETNSTTQGASLLAWGSAQGPQPSAFDELYGTDLASGPLARQHDNTVEGYPPAQPYVLSPAQQAAVDTSRTAPISVVSGMAGNGKSQTVLAIATDAVARGESVLVATKSDAAVDALIDLLDDAPGLRPVVFGSSFRREALSARLSDGSAHGVDAATVRRQRDQLRSAEQNFQAHAAHIRRLVAAEAVSCTLAARSATSSFPRLSSTAPGDIDVLVDRLTALVEIAHQPANGWWTRRRRRRALATLATLSGGQPPIDLEALRVAVHCAEADLDAGSLLANGGLDLGPEWDTLATLDEARRAAAAAWLAADLRSLRRLDRVGLGAVGALATSLRAGRATRRALLERVDRHLTNALPLWLGTLADIDDLLPCAPALFDLVVLDEAAGIEQSLAAPALLRARRAVIVGDPRQLRHVSFVADDAVARALSTHAVSGPAAALLDVRRNSVFDVAAAASPVIPLDEHFRSVPHLVEFAATRLYDGRVQVATRSPATTGVDAVDVLLVDGRRDATNVVAAEVDRVISLLHDALRFGFRSVGVVSPFRAQSDALEAAVLSRFTADDIEALDLRVGTVHAFQGNERDHVIASIGIGPDDGRAWRFVDDPHLLAVLVTRARLRFTIVHSAVPPAGGLFAAYLAQVDEPPGPPRSAAAPATWTARVAEALTAAGVDAIVSYPTGRHLVDVCVRRGATWFGLECSPHPNGPEAHVQRHLDLRRAGWRLVDAYESRWGDQLGHDRLGELVIDVLSNLGGP